MKFLEVKVHDHEIEMHYMSSRSRRVMTLFRKFLKLVEYSVSIGWKARELAWNLYDIEFALL